MEMLVNWFTNHLGQFISKEMLVFLMSMVPVVELRGGVLASTLLSVPMARGILLSYIGNMIPIPFFLAVVKLVFRKIRNSQSTPGPVVGFFGRLAEKRQGNISKTKFAGLLILVAIPLPGTGAYTGALVAGVLDMDFKKSLLTIYCGMLIALGIMVLLSYGLIGSLIS